MKTLIQLTVNNHPGVMSHITGLFSRRSFNLEGILCAPIENGDLSKMYLVVDHNEKFDQVIKQLSKLHDVLEITTKKIDESQIFEEIHRICA